MSKLLLFTVTVTNSDNKKPVNTVCGEMLVLQNIKAVGVFIITTAH
jgi:hypothetical protein